MISYSLDIVFILRKFILMSFMPKICRTFLNIGQDTIIVTRFWMLNCCKKSVISNFHYLFFSSAEKHTSV